MENPQSKSPVYIPETKIETKSHLDKLAEVFLPEDLDSIGSRIYSQIIIPMIMKTAGEIIHRSIDLIFGTNYTGTNSPQPQSPVTQWTNYQNPSQQVQPQGTMQVIPVRSGVYDYAIVRFKTIEDAQRTLNNMRAVIQNTGACTVGKYLDFAGAGSKTIAEDYNYGWTNLTSVRVQNTGDPEFPWRMVLPNPIALQKPNSEIYI